MTDLHDSSARSATDGSSGNVGCYEGAAVQFVQFAETKPLRFDETMLPALAILAVILWILASAAIGAPLTGLRGAFARRRASPPQSQERGPELPL